MASLRRGVGAAALLGLAIGRIEAKAVGNAGTAEPYMFFTQYGADNNEIRECQFGAAHSHMYITQVEPNVCHKVTVTEYSEEKYMMVLTKPGTQVVDQFKDLCDPSCTNCITTMTGLEFSGCFETYEGSGLLLDKYCVGSPELDEEPNTFTALYFSGDECTIEASNLHSVAYVRNYEAKATEGCVVDYFVGNEWRYYKMNFTEKDGTVKFNAKFGCSDKDCTTCKHVLDDISEEECSKATNDADGAFKIMKSSKLEKCGSGPAPPPAPPAGNKWGCMDGRCAVKEDGPYADEDECIKANECAPDNKKYKCSGAPDYRCAIAEDGVGETQCMAECEKPGDTKYHCVVDKCEVSETGVDLAVCEEVCEADPFRILAEQ